MVKMAAALVYTEYKRQTKERNMAEVPHNDIDIDPDFEPQKRPRSCTWPLPRPESNTGKPDSNDDIIPEDEEDYVTAPSISSSTPVNNVNGGITIPQNTNNLSEHQTISATKEEVLTPTSKEETHASQTHAFTALNGLASQPRKSSTRRNAWGNYSYADLITQAIESSPDQRLTLAQIYDWMVRSVTYFKDKGDSNSSAGWKNSIRHNLSLHSRFMRVHNEGTGKSSWWMVNPEVGKSGKAPRRRAVSMDNSNKLIKGARGRAAKKASLGLQTFQDGSSESLSLSSSLSKWTGSPTSRSSDELDTWTDFRSRTNSNASTVSGRLSPILANPELDESLDDDSIAPLSPMLYSSPSRLSPSTATLGLGDMALTMNLNDGLPDHLMGDFLDNISLTASQQPQGQEVESITNQTGSSVFTYTCPGSSSSSSLVVPSSGSFGPPGTIFLLSPPPSSVASLRQSPMQTIQENHQASFSCLSSRFNNHHTLQDLMNLETHGSQVSDVMLTHSDPMMSQASTSVTLSQNSQRNAMLLRKDPMSSSIRDCAAGPNSQTSSVPGWWAQAGLSTPDNEVLCSSNELSQQANQLLQHLPSPSRNSCMQLGGSCTNSRSGSLLQLNAQDHFPIPADLDLEGFNGILDCDIIRNELMDADCLGLCFDHSPLRSDTQITNNLSTAGGFSSSKQTSSSPSWVPS